LRQHIEGKKPKKTKTKTKNKDGAIRRWRRLRVSFEEEASNKKAKQEFCIHRVRVNS